MNKILVSRFRHRFIVMRCWFMVCCSLGMMQAVAQKGSIAGKLTDTTGRQFLSLATVAVFKASDTTLITYRLSDPRGLFKVPGIPFDDSCRVVITHAGSAVHRKTFLLTAATPDLDMGTIQLEPDARLMEEVLVVAERPPVMVRKDTIEFNAEAFKTLPNALVEDLLRKLPGVMVGADGNITVNGRKVNRLLVDGKEFFGSDPQMATKNLPADIIDKIQVTDDKEQMQQDPNLPVGQIGQVVNLKLKRSIKKGWFGKAYAGGGSDERYEAGGILNLFRDTLQVSVLGYTNNINRAGFGMGDINSIGGFNRSGFNSINIMGDGGFALNGISFGATGQGIQQSTGAGMNMNNQIGKNVTLNLQYFYGKISSQVNQLNNRQQFFGDTNMVVRNFNTERNISDAHRFGGFLKWNIDSLSVLEYRPSVTLSGIQAGKQMLYNTFNNVDGNLNESDNQLRLNNSANELANQLTYRRSFRKKGRSLFASGRASFSNNGNDQYNDATNTFYQDGGTLISLLQQLRQRQLNNTSINISANYTEPLNDRFSLQFSENLDYFANKDNVETFEKNGGPSYDQPNEALSNGFSRGGLRSNTRMAVKYTYKKFSIMPGVNYQFLSIDNRFRKNTPIDQRFSFVLPSLQINIAKWNIAYNVNATEPQTNDLQPVQDNTNPLYIQQGNPTLKPAINHSININTYHYDMKNGINYNVYGYGAYSDNAVIRARTVDKSGVQMTMPVNASGIWWMNASLGINKEFKLTPDWKFTTGLNMWTTFNRGLMLLNGSGSETSNWLLNPGINIGLDWKSQFEWRQRYHIDHNRSSYQDPVFPDLNITTHRASTEFVLRLPKRWVWETNLDYRYNPQVAPGMQQNIYRWNAAVNFLFLKENRGQLKLSAFDLLNQNTQVYRTVSENYINDVETTVLKRYFMLTFTYNIRQLGGKVGGRTGLFLF